MNSASTKAAASAWPSPSASSNGTAARSGSNPGPGKARPSISRCAGPRCPEPNDRRRARCRDRDAGGEPVRHGCQGERMSETIRILLVEDNPGDADLTKETLEENRVHVAISVAVDGPQALDRLHR